MNEARMRIVTMLGSSYGSAAVSAMSLAPCLWRTWSNYTLYIRIVGFNCRHVVVEEVEAHLGTSFDEMIRDMR